MTGVQTCALPILLIIAIATVTLLKPTLTIVAGIILVAACPGGAMSNYYVYLANANVALSVTLSAVSTLMGFFTLPLLATLGFELLLNGVEHIEIPAEKMIGQLFLLLVLPTACGMWIKYRWPRWTLDHTKALRIISLLILALVILFVILNQAEQLLIH